MEISLSRGDITPSEIPVLKCKFYNKLAQTMTRDNEYSLAAELTALAETTANEARIYSAIMRGAINA